MRLVASGEAQVLQCLVVDGEETARRAVLRGHVPDRGAVGQRQPHEPGAEVLHELPDDAGRPQDLRHGQHEVGRGRALRQRAGQLEPDDLRDQHRDRLAEHRGLRLDPADAPAEHAEPVDHRRVRVGADERVGERLAVARLDDAREELEVHLVDDPRVRRDDLEVVERLLTPAQERVALPVALELELGVAEDRARRRVLVDLHGVVDHKLDRQLRVDPRRVAAEIRHRVPHRREVDDRRHAGEVLQEDAGGSEGDLVGRLGLRIPAADRLRVGLLAVPLSVLQEDPKRVGQAEDVAHEIDST
jgi:hypothetical protein